MTHWQLLRDAYGSAEPVEALLARGDSDDSAVWEELWSRLCHQGTVYTASYAALPRLAELAEHWQHSTFVQPLFLATCIIASTDGPERPAAIRAQHADPIRVLHDVAERLVDRVSDDADFVYSLQALLATEGDSVWATDLEALVNQELEFACPGCDEQLLINFEASPAVVAAFDDRSFGTRPVQASDPDEITGAEARAYQLALACDRSHIAKQLLDLFGVFECPRCHFKAKTSDSLG